MHELGLAQDVLGKAKAEAKAKGLSKVTYVKARVGETLVTDPPELVEIFETITVGSALEGAKLEVVLSQLKVTCSACKNEFHAKTLRLDCPNCESTNLEVTGGKELIIEEIK